MASVSNLLRAATKAFLRLPRWFASALCLLFICPYHLFAQAEPRTQAVNIAPHELSRPARPWEFLDAVGKRSGILGNESGRFEAWVYPIKIFRDFDVTFVLENRRIPAASLVRELVMRPEGPTLTFTSDAFTVKESWLAPPDASGAIIRFEVDTWEPLQIEASFTRDFQLMWPAGLGGTYMSWNSQLHAFDFGEEGRKYSALVGSPSAIGADPEFFSNSYSSSRSTLRLAPVAKGKSVSYVFIAGSATGRDEARKNYEALNANPENQFAATRKYYEDYLARTLSLDLTDPQLQAAFDWSRLSTIQGLVANPYLGTGLVAGYRSSGDSARPGFAWFFGRDSLWTDLALDSIGDFDTARTALDFIAKYQRQDGKIEHEISQTASLVNWWTGYPYAYASADATPLFLIALNDYVAASGDVAFANTHWDNAWRAYQFLKSTYDANGLPRNAGIGHGWIEGGPLLPVETESYQSGLGAAALKAFSSMAQAVGKTSESASLEREFAAQQKKVNDAFWDSQGRTLVFALNQQNTQIKTPTVLSTAPMWFDIFDSANAKATIDHLARPDDSADWGMRIISDQDPLYGPTGYHFGSVWPLFTGWAAVGEYRNHRPLEAYANLRANSLLALDGSLGRVTEVLSGSYYEDLGTASPHQIWSSAMVISPLVRGMLGLSVNEREKTVTLAPHLPANWDRFSLHHLTACGSTYDIAFHRDSRSIKFSLSGNGTACTFLLSPSLSLHAHVGAAMVNGRKTIYKIDADGEDQHVSIRAIAPAEIVVQVDGDFGLATDAELPRLGSESRNLKISHEEWSKDRRQLTLEVSGLSGSTYDLPAYGAKIASASGAEVKQMQDGSQILGIKFAEQDAKANFVTKKIELRF